MDTDDSAGGDRYVNVSYRLSASGVWDRECRAMHPTQLPIPDALADWIVDWAERYDEMSADAPGMTPDEAFQREGRAIVAALRVVLSDWTVVYDAPISWASPRG
ncbi:MAG: hypothetical protein U1E40_11085 [Amaricoccus sp.]